MSERVQSLIEKLSPIQKKLLIDLYNFDVKRISLDFDQIMVSSEEPVKEEFFIQTGVDYRDRQIDQWLALANWASNDGKMTFEEAKSIEQPIWEDPDILYCANPVKIIQDYSKSASEKGVFQSVVTTRIPKLRESTIEWIRINYPWIDVKDIYIRKDVNFPGDTFKGLKVAELFSRVHFEDSLSSTKSVIGLSTASVILFPRRLEAHQLSDERVIEFKDFEEWEMGKNELI